MTTLPKGTRCECRDPNCHWRRNGQCPRDAVRLVTVEVKGGPPSEPWYETRQRQMCEPCSKHHGARDERSILCDCGKPKARAAVACDQCLGRASHTERTTAKGGDK